jgi:FtsH-binding integral membrane protein
MSNIKYSDIRDGRDSASAPVLNEEISDIYKWFGSLFLFSGLAALSITKLESMSYLSSFLITPLALICVLASGYYGYRVVYESHRFLGKTFMVFHALSWGILLSPMPSISDTMDMSPALLSCATLLICMSFMGQVEEYLVVGKASLFVMITVGVVSSFLISILVLNSGAISFLLSVFLIISVSYVFWIERSALRVMIYEVTEHKNLRDKVGILGAMHLSGAVTGIFIPTFIRRIK